MHRDATLLLLGVSTFVGMMIVAVVLTSAAMPQHRVWPPKYGKNDWRFWLVWTLIGAFLASFVGLGLSTFGTMGLSRPWTFGLGAFLFVAGNILAWWGAGAIGSTATLGLKSQLTTEGLYRWSRNPQYLGDILVLVGLAVFSNSTAIVAPLALGCMAAAFAPFAEEPWLEEQYGEDFDAYCKQVPRFF